jgi:nitric oxide reductase NorD protein
MIDPQSPLAAYWRQLDTRFKQVEEVFADTMAEAQAVLGGEGISAYIEAAHRIGKFGRGVEPMLLFLEKWPQVAQTVGESALPGLMNCVQKMQNSPNGKAIAGLLQTLPAVARRTHASEPFQHYLDIVAELMARTTGSIHGHHSTFPSPGLPEFLEAAPRLLDQLSIAGLRNWVEYGIRNYADHPQRQQDYFALRLADSKAVLQRERHGTLFADVERRLDLYLRGLWRDSVPLVPYSFAYDEIRRPVPYYDQLGMRIPDVFDDHAGVAGVDRYRAVLAHMVGHRRYSQPLIADNWSPFQRMAVEFFEDCRVDVLLMREYPGLKRIFLALHPKPVADACDPATTSCLRHRLAMFSRATLDAEHGYQDADLNDFVGRFHTLIADGRSSSAEVAALALAYVARTRRQSDQFAKIHFADTVVDYRDDNRQLWKFIESGDEEESFDDKRHVEPAQEIEALPPRHYAEWDYRSQTYRPDWVSLYEALHPAGDAGAIDRLLDKHAALAKRLKRLLDLLKPQDKVRIRYQEEGSELDLDIALRSLIDFKSGCLPDPRINMSHRRDGRDITVMLLLDLSESLNQPASRNGTAAGGEQTILQLSQEAVSLLAWAIDCLGDPFAIAGFHSNTRHEVRFQHIKGFSEGWDDGVKSRLAAMEAGWSTRMGAAIRHAGHYLSHRQSDKKILLLLTDGEPADVDMSDGEYLHADAKKAVDELAADGMATFCVSLDARADDYVRRIFGTGRYMVLDHIERLPERLPALYLALTR